MTPWWKVIKAKSKWTKTDFLAVAKEFDVVDEVKKIPLKTLREHMQIHDRINPLTGNWIETKKRLLDARIFIILKLKKMNLFNKEVFEQVLKEKYKDDIWNKLTRVCKTRWYELPGEEFIFFKRKFMKNNKLQKETELFTSLELVKDICYLTNNQSLVEKEYFWW